MRPQLEIYGFFGERVVRLGVVEGTAVGATT